MVPRSSWLAGVDGHAHFSLLNIPYGIFSVGEGTPRVGIRLGDYAVDLLALAEAGYFDRSSLGRVEALRVFKQVRSCMVVSVSVS